MMMNATSTNKMDEYTSIINDVMKEKILDLREVLREKDDYTYQHCQRVLDYSFMLGLELSLPKNELEDLAIAAFFHDVGKIAIPDKILKKTDVLTNDEMIVMQNHPRTSAGVLRVAGGSRESVKALACHHERYDGKGYPYGLHKENIPLLSRIISVADEYDYMTSNRRYAKGLEKIEAIRRLLLCSGDQFDPMIIEVFVGRLERPQENLS